MLGTLNLVKPFCVMLQDNGHLLLQALPSRLSTDCYYLLYLITFSISAFFPCVLTHKLDSSSSDHLLAQIFLPGEPFLWFHVHPCLLWRLLSSFLYKLCRTGLFIALVCPAEFCCILLITLGNSLEFVSWKNWRKS